jgi:IPT/TIG domain
MTTQQTITGAEIGLLSYLFEAVGDLLTPAQRQELTDQLTSLRPAGVAPGELITAELFNAMLNNINDLLARVAVLEGAEGGPVITGILPGNQPISVNTVITIVGTGFNAEPRLNKVIIDGRELTEFRDGSGSTALVVPIPDLFNGLPKTTPISVETGGRRSNGFPITLAPAPRLQIGDFSITAVSAPTGNMAAGATIVFEWDVLANTSLDDELSFEIIATQLTGSNATQWRNAATFFPVAPLPIDPGQTRRVAATIVVPAAAVQATLALRVKGIGDQVISDSEPIEWVAGNPLETSSTNAVLSFSLASPGNLIIEDPMNVGGTNMRGIRVRQGRFGIVNIQVSDERAVPGPLARYTFTAVPETNAAQWNLAPGPNPPEIDDFAAGADDTFSIRLANVTGPVDQITILRVEANQTATAAGLAPFTSFINIPLKIVP